MKKETIQVTIDPGCISCGRCQEMAPAVFRITDCAHICVCANQEKVFAEHAHAIVQAAAQCPVQVIKVIKQ